MNSTQPGPTCCSTWSNTLGIPFRTYSQVSADLYTLWYGSHGNRSRCGDLTEDDDSLPRNRSKMRSSQSFQGKNTRSSDIRRQDTSTGMRGSENRYLRYFQFHCGSIRHPYSKFQNPILSQSVPRIYVKESCETEFDSPYDLSTHKIIFEKQLNWGIIKIQ